MMWQRLLIGVMVCGLAPLHDGWAQQATASANGDRGITPPADYVIGPDDVLVVQFWSDKEMSAEVTVRPDGRIALPLLNDLQASGLTPEQLRETVLQAAQKYVEDPNPTVLVKEIKSRKVFITGQVQNPGSYPMNDSLTVLQLIALAGGLREFVNGKNINVLRYESGEPRVFRFNYQDVLNARKLEQNIKLKPGDTVVVP